MTETPSWELRLTSFSPPVVRCGTCKDKSSVCKFQLFLSNIIHPWIEVPGAYIPAVLDSTMTLPPRGVSSHHLVTCNRDGLLLRWSIPDIVVYHRVGSFAGVTVSRVAKGG